MTDIYRFTGGALCANSYVLTVDGKNCIMIDCADALQAEEFFKIKKLDCRVILLTHGHFDHCGDVSLLQQSGVDIYIHESECLLLNGDANLAHAMGNKFISFVPDKLLKDGDKLDMYGLSVSVIHTPGHTQGSVCYLIDNKFLFSGDTLFYMGVGRTDFPTGDANALKNSLTNKLFLLDKDYTVYPGHDKPTTLFFERDNNPYV